MNEIFDRLLELPLRQRVLVLGGTAAAVLFLYLTYFYWPMSSRVAEMEEQVANLRQDRDRKKALVSNLDAMRRAVADLDAALKLATAQLPDSKEIPDLLSNVSSLGRESGLEMLVFRQRQENFQEFYAEVPVEIRVQGTYHQVGTFFDKVGRLDRIVNVNEINLKQPRTVGDTVFVDAGCAATTYRFLDEAEREKIAKEKAKEGAKSPQQQ